jgi:hypothetical protein
MDFPCQLCGREAAAVIVYARWFQPTGYYKEIVTSDFKWTVSKTGSSTFGCLQFGSTLTPRVDVVELARGTVIRHEYKKPLPAWLKEPMLRSIAMQTMEVPNQKTQCPPAS